MRADLKKNGVEWRQLAERRTTIFVIVPSQYLEAQEGKVWLRLFGEARALSKGVAANPADPPEFGGWLAILSDKSRDGSHEWEDTLHAVTDYFGLSTD